LDFIGSSDSEEFGVPFFDIQIPDMKTEVITQLPNKVRRVILLWKHFFKKWNGPNGWDHRYGHLPEYFLRVWIWECSTFEQSIWQYIYTVQNFEEAFCANCPIFSNEEVVTAVQGVHWLHSVLHCNIFLRCWKRGKLHRKLQTHLCIV